MDGVFMFKFIRRIMVLLMIGTVLFGWSLYTDKKQLSDQVIRLHVVGASDSDNDQRVKLLVRDAVLSVVEDCMENADDKSEASNALESKLELLETTANAVLEQEGVEERATVTLLKEEFPSRAYDTFTLPAGVYDSLRVTIGSGEGRNWWCVVFPRLCVDAAVSEVEDVAAGAGFSDSLGGAITGKQEYQLRFFLLDWMGRVENFFHRR